MKFIRFYLLILVSASLLFGSGCAKIEEVEVGDIRNFEMTRFTGSGIEFEISLPVENPNRFRVRVVEADVDIIHKGRKLGRIKNPENLVIPAGSSEVHTLSGTIMLESLSGGSSSLLSIFFDRSADVELTGNIKVRSFIYSRTFQVNEKFRIDF